MANKTFDSLGLIVEDEAVTTTATCTGAEISGLNIGSASYVAVINSGDVTGTVDESNYYTVQLKASDAVDGTYYEVGDAKVLSATAEQTQIGFTSEQLNGIIADAAFFAVTVTKTGTTATACSYTAFVSKV